jgi:hypothetical protein
VRHRQRLHVKVDECIAVIAGGRGAALYSQRPLLLLRRSGDPPGEPSSLSLSLLQCSVDPSRP